MAITDFESQLNLTSQHPLDGKILFSTYSAMNANLQTKAFTYYEGMIAYCFDRKKQYEWKELPSKSLIPDYSFTYPDNWVVDGMDYSNRRFQFQEVGGEIQDFPITDGLYTGYITWDSGLKYIYTDLVVGIGGNFYSIEAGSIELNPADDTHPRKDTITARLITVGDTTVAQISFIPGEPSENPIEPTVAYAYNEIRLTSADIDANATEPTNATKVLIYDENDGGPNEYDVVAPYSSITLDNTEHPYTGTKCIKVNYALMNPGDNIVMTAIDPIDIADIDALTFFSWLSNEISGINDKTEDPQNYIRIRLFNDALQYGQEVRLQNGKYGFSTAVLDKHQTIIIPAEEFSGPSFSSIINKIEFTFSGQVANEVFLDTFNFVLGQTPINTAKTFLSLLDVLDDTYEDKEMFGPTVQKGKLKLTRNVQFSDLHRGNAIINGGWSHVPGTNQTYDFFATLFIINNVVYNTFVSGTKTLAAAPGSPNQRIDVPVVNANPISEPPIFTIEIVQGVSGVSPVDKPSTNSFTQAEFPFKLLTSDEVTPPEVTTDVVYNENAEWPNTIASTGVILNDTEPKDGAVNVSLPKSSSSEPAQVAWQKVSLIPYNEETNAIFWLKVDAPWSRSGTLQFQLRKGTEVMSSITFNYNSITKYGYNHSKWGNYYLILIPIRYLQQWSRSFVDYDTLYFSAENLGPFKLDLVHLQGGLSQPGGDDGNDGAGGGTELIDEGNGEGLVVTGRTAANYGNVGANARDFSRSSSASSDRGALAADSVAFGLNNINKVIRSLVWGSGNEMGPEGNSFGGDGVGGINNKIYGFSYNNFVSGWGNILGTPGAPQLTAVAYGSLVQGYYNNIYGAKDGLYVGILLLSGSAGSSVIGVANKDLSPDTATSAGASVNGYKPRFIVGVGTVTYNSQTVILRRNGFVVMSDGTVSFPSLTKELIKNPVAPTNADSDWVKRVPVTKEYLEDVILTADVQILSAALLDTQANPVLLIDGGLGGNVWIDIVSISGSITGTTTPYDFGPKGLPLKTASGNHSVIIPQNIINSAVDTPFKLDVNSNAGSVGYDENFEATVGADPDPTVGTGILNLRIMYRKCVVPV